MKKCIDDADVCFKRILKLSEVRERCSFELEKRLVGQEGFSKKAYKIASSRAQDYGILDDLRYAEFYIRMCANCHKGIFGALKHLDYCKINYKDNEELQQLIDALQETEADRAYEFICIKKSRSKNLFNSYMTRLIRRGFSADISYQAVTKYLSNNKESN